MGNESDDEYGLSRADDTEIVEAPELSYLPPRPKRLRPKIGLIGAGGISEYHLRAYRAMDLNVAIICDVDLSRAESRRDEFYPDAVVTQDFRQVLAERDVEVVDITTHPEDRVEIIELALRSRKHVLSQKPFVVDLDVGHRLIALAEKCNVRLAINQNGRWAPHFSYMAAALQQDLIGPVSSIDFSLQWDHTWIQGTPFEDIHHLLLYDFGIHWFDITTLFLHEQVPKQVFSCVNRTAYQSMKPPFLAQSVIQFADAQVCLSLNAHTNWGQQDQTIVVGQKGTLRATGPSLNEQTVSLWTEQGKAVANLKGRWFDNGFQGTMGELLCAIEEDREPSNSARRVLPGVALCFAAMASADRNQVLRPGDVRRI